MPNGWVVCWPDSPISRFAMHFEPRDTRPPKWMASPQSWNRGLPS